MKIVGSGSHCKVIIDCALSNGYKIECIIDINSIKKTNEKIFGIPVENKNTIKKIKKNDLVFLAIGDNKIRSYYFKILKLKLVKFINLISKNSFVSRHAILGDGILINNNCIINAGSKFNNNCIINSGAIIEHDVKLEKIHIFVLVL